MEKAIARRGRRRTPSTGRGAGEGTSSPAIDTHRRHGPLIGLLLTTLVIKTTVLAQLGGHALLQPQGELDTAQYVELAQKVAAGGPLALTEPFFVSPLYVYFLAAVFSLGGSITAARIVQIVLGTAAVGLVFLTARHWFGEKAAWIAGGLASLAGLFTFYEILILQAAIDPFLVAAALYFISRGQADENGWCLAAAGMATGLLVLNRPNALVYGAIVAVWLALPTGPLGATSRGVATLGRALLFPVCLLLILVSNGVRNHAVSGEWILISSHGGLNFYIGNSLEARGIYSRVQGITPSIAGQSQDAARMAESDVGHPLSPSEVSDYFYRKAWSWIAGQPVEAARLFVWKALILLNRTNVPLNHSYAYFQREETSLLRGLVVGPWLLVPLGLTGLFLPSARRTKRGFWVWASFVPVYGLSVAVFFVSSRYRMPMLVPLTVASGGALGWWLEQLRARRLAPLVAPTGACAVLAVLVNWPLGLDDGRGFEQARLAVWLVEQGRFDEAEEYVNRIEPRHTHPGVLHYRVGRALSERGRFDDAVPHLREALVIDGGQSAIELELGQVLTIIGEPREAVSHLAGAFEAGYRPEVSGPWLVRALVACREIERAADVLTILPDEIFRSRPDTALDLGKAALSIEAMYQAERWLRLAAENEAAPAEAHEKLGVTLLLLDRLPDAVASLEAACRLDPSSAAAHLNLGVAYARLGRLDDARAEAEQALRLDPDEPRAVSFRDALGPRRKP